MLRFTFGTDLHGIEQHKRTVHAFLSFVKEFKPELKVFGGDLWNLAALRRQADEHEKVIRLKEDFLAGIEFLKEYKPSILMIGNHDQRLYDAVKRERVNRTGWLSELADTYLKQFHEFVDANGIKIYPYEKKKGIFRVHGMAFAHGFGSGGMLSQNMAETYGDIIHGHGHKIERTTAMHSGHAVTAFQSGCLCRDDMEYTRADLGSLRQEQGWVYGVLGKINEVVQARFVKGRAIVTTDFKVVI